MRRNPNSFPDPAQSRRVCAGFSLIELLLVLTILPIVSFAVYSNFNSGIGLWKRLNRPVFEEDIQVFQTKASRDFLETLVFSPISFQGDPERASFPATVRTQSRLGGDRGIGQVTYRYDSDTRAILREERNYVEFCAEKPGRISSVLTGVDSCVLSYMVYDEVLKSYSWSDVWSGKPNQAPAAVRFTYTHTFGERRDAVDTFFVPVGGK
jgi:prepilin-type N-terminal cleavage/methylation domain-containing protein